MGTFCGVVNPFDLIFCFQADNLEFEGYCNVV